jgi:hypothetical protein
MKKAIVLVAVVLAGLLAGCSALERFQQAEAQYLETRVSDLVEEMTTVEPPAVDEPKELEPTVEEEEVVETPEVTDEVTVEPTEEPEVEEAPSPTEEPEPVPEPTIESDDPAIYLGDPDWVDEMDKPEYWPVGSDTFTAASFENGAMKFVALSDVPGWRIASTNELGKAYIEATVKMGAACSETDSYGILFRVPKNSGYNRGYFFGVTCDGRYNLRMWDGLSGESGKSITLKYFTASDVINKGKNQVNRLGVMTVGDRLLLFVNGEYVDEIVDETYDLGFFGLFVNSDKTKDLTVYVDQVRYWLDAEPK